MISALSKHHWPHSIAVGDLADEWGQRNEMQLKKQKNYFAESFPERARHFSRNSIALYFAMGFSVVSRSAS